jgi:hypothetical protein
MPHFPNIVDALGKWGIVHKHWGKADDRNCNYGHPKMADVESGKNLF